MIDINKISNVLATPGTVGVLPTDTVYGLVCRAVDKDAVARLYALKHREAKPGTIIAANIEQLVELGIPRRYLKPVAEYWPNPISIVVPIGMSLEELHLGQMSLALRVPKNVLLHELLIQTGPLLTTSANQPGEPVAVTIAQARAYFDNDVDLYVDGGNLSGHEPSTIIRVVDDAIEVLRQGAVRLAESGEIMHEEDTAS